jgi:hypothetical protein
VDSVGFSRNLDLVLALKRPRPLVALGAVAWTLGCLPAGEPPAGQHILHDRTLTGVAFAPSEMDGVPSRLLATGPLRQLPKNYFVAPLESFADLYEVPLEETSGASTAPLPNPIIEGVVLELGKVDTRNVSTDARGRPVYLKYRKVSSYDDISVERHDWSTGNSSPLGSPRNWDERPFLLSPGRTRVLTNFLTDLDSWPRLGPLDASQGIFIGEDFYGVVRQTGTTVLVTDKPGAEPEFVLASTGALGLAAIQSADASQALVCASGTAVGGFVLPCGFGYQPFAILDLKTLATSALPIHESRLHFISTSDDGHWLLFSAPNRAYPDFNLDLLLHDWTTNTTERVDSTIVDARLSINGASEWRPGRSELWFYFYLASTRFGTWTPQAGFEVREGNPVTVRQMPENRTSMFTRRGTYWFSRDAQKTIFVGPADDPSVPGFPIHPVGTLVEEAWETSDGRLIVGASTVDNDRQDLAIVDPATGASRSLASGGHLVALGHSRALAIVSWETTRQAGDLVLIDLETAQQTLLAENVHGVAVDPGTSADVPPDADRLRPGSRVAFLTRSRLESPYDGLWVATLP